MTENMDTDPFNISLRKFLKQVGVTSQRAIEQTVENGGLRGKGKLTVRAVITADGEVLNDCGRWCNITTGIVGEIAEAWVVRLGNVEPT